MQPLSAPTAYDRNRNKYSAKTCKLFNIFLLKLQESADERKWGYQKLSISLISSLFLFFAPKI